MVNACFCFSTELAYFWFDNYRLYFAQIRVINPTFRMVPRMWTAVLLLRGWYFWGRESRLVALASFSPRKSKKNGRKLITVGPSILVFFGGDIVPSAGFHIPFNPLIYSIPSHSNIPGRHPHSWWKHLKMQHFIQKLPASTAQIVLRRGQEYSHLAFACGWSLCTGVQRWPLFSEKILGFPGNFHGSLWQFHIAIDNCHWELNHLLKMVTCIDVCLPVGKNHLLFYRGFKML